MSETRPQYRCLLSGLFLGDLPSAPAPQTSQSPRCYFLPDVFLNPLTRHRHPVRAGIESDTHQCSGPYNELSSHRGRRWYLGKKAASWKLLPVPPMTGWEPLCQGPCCFANKVGPLVPCKTLRPFACTHSFLPSTSSRTNSNPREQRADYFKGIIRFEFLLGSQFSGGAASPSQVERRAKGAIRRHCVFREYS